MQFSRQAKVTLWHWNPSLEFVEGKTEKEEKAEKEKEGKTGKEKEKKAEKEKEKEDKEGAGETEKGEEKEEEKEQKKEFQSSKKTSKLLKFKALKDTFLANRKWRCGPSAVLYGSASFAKSGKDF